MTETSTTDVLQDIFHAVDAYDYSTGLGGFGGDGVEIEELIQKGSRHDPFLELTLSDGSQYRIVVETLSPAS